VDAAYTRNTRHFQMLVALAVLLVFGPRKLPELARGIGESMKELKHSLHGARTEGTALGHEAVLAVDKDA
jgi:TatA/E family protein of Tat protein translocase